MKHVCHVLNFHDRSLKCKNRIRNVTHAKGMFGKPRNRKVSTDTKDSSADIRVQTYLISVKVGAYDRALCVGSVYD